MRIAKLIMVTADNHNKFYDMVENTDGSISIDFGRVGVTSTKLVYPVGKKKWESLYNEKVKKGYVDQTANRVIQTSGSSFVDIKDGSIATLVSNLQKYANRSVVENYTVCAEAVTQAQVDSAQSTLDQIIGMARPRVNTDKINAALLQLYAIIPRKMKHVKQHLIEESHISSVNIDTINKMLASEQATLDVMRGQVAQTRVQQSNVHPTHNILDALGLEVSPFDEAARKLVRDMLGDNARRFVSGFRVHHKTRREQFEGWVKRAEDKKVRQLWHGSRNENWWNILQTGLLIRPANAVISGAMFGYGIYGADLAQKSIGYTSLSGSCWANGVSPHAYLGVFSFHLGTEYQTDQHDSWMSGLDYQKLTKMGKYDSFHARKGRYLRNDEYIIYNAAQVDIWAIIEIG